MLRSATATLPRYLASRRGTCASAAPHRLALQAMMATTSHVLAPRLRPRWRLAAIYSLDRDAPEAGAIKGGAASVASGMPLHVPSSVKVAFGLLSAGPATTIELFTFNVKVVSRSPRGLTAVK